jgi:hypothetical protein
LLFDACQLAYQAFSFDNSAEGEESVLFAHFKLEKGRKVWGEIDPQKVPYWFRKYYSQEGNRRFCNALFLAKLFAYQASENGWIEEHHREAILSLYPRVQLLSFRANLTTFWEGILKYLSDEGAIDLSAYYVKEDAYKIYIPQLITYLDQQPIPECPVQKDKLEKDLAFIQGEYEPLRLVTVAQLENIRYWVWVYKNISGNIFSFYVTVSQDEQRKSTFRKHPQHGGIHTSPERLLLEEHYR